MKDRNFPPPDAPPNQRVYLPALVSDQFGVSQTIARDQILLGMVTIGGERWDAPDGGRPDGHLWVPRAQIEGKEVEVKGRDRSFKFTFED